jgi:pimeloyl-ACP methyl ester carboxylesterase
MRPIPTTALLLALLVLAAGSIRTEVLAARAERDFPPEGRFVEIDGARIHFVERGAGSPIVLLHGAFGGTQDWTATGIVDALAPAHRVLAFDRPGHGWSERVGSVPQGPLEQARTLRAACRALGVEHPILVGFSWSGAAVLAWSIEWPEEIAGVVTVNGVAYSWPGATNTPYVLASFPLIDSLLAHTIAAPFGELTSSAAVERAFAPAVIPESFVRSPIPLALRPDQFLVEAADMRLLKPALTIQCTRYSEIRVPVEILAGRDDLVAQCAWHSERLHGVAPGSALTVVEGAGHQMLYSYPNAVIEAIERLDARVERP